MALKTKTIKLTYGHNVKRGTGMDAPMTPYRVAQITDSIEFAPGEFLTQADVRILCGHRDWKVTIVPKD